MAKRKDLIKGTHAVEEAIDSGHPIRKVLIQKGLKDERLRNLLQDLRQHEIPIQYVPKEKLNKFSSNHQGIIALSSPIEFQNLSALVPMLFEQGKSPIICLLDSITDVRNFGAIARSAEFLGIDAIVIPMHGTSDINEDAVKASAGGLLKVPICREKNLQETVVFLKESGFQVVAASEKNKTPIADIDFNVPTVIVLGSEDVGISKELLKECTHFGLIPRIGTLDSLNVSVAAGIFFYEACHQRMKWD